MAHALALLGLLSSSLVAPPARVNRPPPARRCCAPSSREYFRLPRQQRERLEYFELPKAYSEAEVRRQYKRLAAKLHPDLNRDADAVARFQECTREYERLLGECRSAGAREELSRAWVSLGGLAAAVALMCNDPSLCMLVAAAGSFTAWIESNDGWEAALAPLLRRATSSRGGLLAALRAGSESVRRHASSLALPATLIPPRGEEVKGSASPPLRGEEVKGSASPPLRGEEVKGSASPPLRGEEVKGSASPPLRGEEVKGSASPPLRGEEVKGSASPPLRGEEVKGSASPPLRGEEVKGSASPPLRGEEVKGSASPPLRGEEVKGSASPPLRGEEVKGSASPPLRGEEVKGSASPPLRGEEVKGSASPPLRGEEVKGSASPPLRGEEVKGSASPPLRGEEVKGSATPPLRGEEVERTASPPLRGVEVERTASPQRSEEVDRVSHARREAAEAAARAASLHALALDAEARVRVAQSELAWRRHVFSSAAAAVQQLGESGTPARRERAAALLEAARVAAAKQYAGEEALEAAQLNASRAATAAAEAARTSAAREATLHEEIACAASGEQAWRRHSAAPPASNPPRGNDLTRGYDTHIAPTRKANRYQRSATEHKKRFSSTN
ncbi:hypothetical protein AB1Y20_014136 [Prymnesium parvum]|uniref:J domain-containing protein n=1 Tax=Prymnesium parvum TaxID=97485 RepID=A0AB34IF50_PRYPA